MSASSSRGAKSESISGWTAFDLKQRRKQQGLEASNHDSDPYPSLSPLTQPQTFFNKNGDKPFSSLLAPSINFSSLKDKNLPPQLPPTTTSSLKDATLTVDTLRDLQPWADESLIQDVLASVNNNVHQALSLLEDMLISEDHLRKNKKLVTPDISFSEKERMINFINGNHELSMSQESSLRLLDTIKSLPIESEPQWGEDDAYLVFRKDGIRMIRSASRHSKSANDAYIRGDHAAARHFSFKAQQEWAAAERLNAKAAKEILNVRNCRNDLWTLDLHGLHAAEAVEALLERLKTVESLVSPSSLAAQQGILKESGVPVDGAVQSTGQLDIEKFGRQHPTSRQRVTLLQVITGKGNHSRGFAALPSAIRNFLSENGYHFDETRPGVIMVRPKFRLQ
ncbi:hypothetical protein C2S51_023918 [Perilla frutescens var. frutescens]|nr:hypothetical protein C2S51_023918 [Perilla frutescens var. frutescens]